MARRPWVVALVAAIGISSAQADPPVSEGRLRLSVIGAYGMSYASADGLPPSGSVQAVVSIAHVDRAKQSFADGIISFVGKDAALRIYVAKEDHGMWPVSAVFTSKDEEPQTLELHLVGITPAAARRLEVRWGAERMPRIVFGEHQEVEFGRKGFVPRSLQIGASYGMLALDDLRIVREAGAR